MTNSMLQRRPADRCRACNEHAVGRRGREPPRRHGRQRPAQRHCGIHPSDQPRRPRSLPGSSRPCSPGRVRATSRTTRRSSTTTRPSTSTSKRNRSRHSRRVRWTVALRARCLSIMRQPIRAVRPNTGAGAMKSPSRPEMLAGVGAIADRTWEVTEDSGKKALAEAELKSRADDWAKEAGVGGRMLVYQKYGAGPTAIRCLRPRASSRGPTGRSRCRCERSSQA